MMGMVYAVAFTALAVSWCWLVVLNLRSERRVTELEEMLTSFLKYGQSEPPHASVRDPGPIDDESKVHFEIRGRMIDRATEFLAQEGRVSTHRAREEAERLIAAFESSGRPE